jgi:phosphatidate cytidylyltransferase
MNLASLINSIDPRELWLTAIALSALALGWIVSSLLHRLGVTGEKLHRELILRLRTWAIIIPATVIPILIGPAGIAVAVLLLGVLCFREFAHATGLARDLPLFASLLAGLLIVAIAVFKHDYQLLLFSAPLVAVLSMGASLLRDQPEGYLKRIALTNLGFMLCGLWPGHLGFLGGLENNAALLLWFILSTELNDVFAFICGKTFGRTALCFHTSPGKTRGGLIGAMLLTSTFVTLSGSLLFQGEMLGNPTLLIPLGLILSLSGTAGDLILSSIKRDLHLKDLANTLPGHGGLLDRCDSLLFAAPVVALALGLIHTLPTLQPPTTQLP